MPLVSIGLPVYNAGKFLHDAIQSILNQTFKDFELIIIDDGCSDNSLQIIKSFDDARIKVISDGKNKGLPARLNEIAQHAKGKYLARMDADDIMFIERIEEQVNILENQPEIDVLGSNALSIDEFNNIRGAKRETEEGAYDIRKINFFIHPTIIGKTKWFIANPYDEGAKRVEDAELWWRTNQKYHFYEAKRPLLFYREFGGDYNKKYKNAKKGMNFMFLKFLKERQIKTLFKFTVKNYLPFIIKKNIYYIANLMNKEDKIIQNRYIEINPEQLLASKVSLQLALQEKCK